MLTDIIELLRIFRTICLFAEYSDFNFLFPGKFLNGDLENFFIHQCKIPDMSFVLGIDIGTSGVRGAVFDESGKMLSNTFSIRRWKVAWDSEGKSFINADEALTEILKLIDEIVEGFSGSYIELAGVSCFLHSLVGIDESGSPTTEVILWSDTRSNEQAKFLRQNLDEKNFHQLTGARFHSSFLPAKLLWIKERDAYTWERTAKWISFADYFSYRLFGDLATSASIASASGIFEIKHRRWCDDLLNFLNLSSAKMPFVAESHSLFNLKAELCKRWRALSRTRWFLPIGDGAANNLGAGGLHCPAGVLMIGSSGAIRTIIQDETIAEIPSGLWCYRVDENRLIMGGAISDAGTLYDWLKDNLRFTEPEFLFPNSHGLSFLPFLVGERSVGYNLEAKGAIAGIRIYTTASEIFQSALEAVAYGFADILEQLESVFSIDELILVGKPLLESKTWKNVIVDVLGKDAILSTEREASLKGSIVFALEKSGHDLKDIALEPTIQIFPNMENHQVYKNARQKYQHFYRLMLQDK